MKTSLIAGIAIICLIVGGFVGYAFAPSQTVFEAAGDTSSTAKISQVVLDLSTTTPTTVSGSCKLYNGDSRDRIISSVTYYLAGLGTMTGASGTGVATLNWTIGTSTGVYLAAGNKVLNTTVATATPQLFIASTTPGATGSAFVRVWESGTCLNVFTNATSSTATGIIRVDYSQAQD